MTFTPRHILQQKCSRTCGRKSGPSGGNSARDEKAREAAAEKVTSWEDMEFISIDGEGVTTTRRVREEDPETGEVRHVSRKIHKYVTLVCGDQVLENGGKSLHYKQIFPFLYAQFEAHPEAAFVGFALGYDFAMWFRSFREDVGMELFEKSRIAKRKTARDGTERFAPWPVRTEARWSATHEEFIGAGWEIDILGSKRFRLRPFVPRSEYIKCAVNHKSEKQQEECDAGRHNKHPYKHMFICDAFAFFQTSFVGVINPNPKDKKAADDRTWVFDPEYPELYDPGYDVTTHPKYVPESDPNRYVTDAEFQMIVRGKARRSTAQLDDDMRAYNTLECEVLSRVMRKMNKGYCRIGVNLTQKQWFGPGQAAQAWLKASCPNLPTGAFIRGETKEQQDAHAEPPVPDWAREAARRSYYGGWFEIFNHGHVPGTVHNYDINSAYPYIIANLPCLLHGEWNHGKGNPGRLRKGELRLIYGTFYGRDYKVGAMLHRNEHGSIVRPRKTKGWHWQHEIDAAKRAGVVTNVTVHEWVTYLPCKCDPPVKAIETLYLDRIDPLKGEDFKNSPQGKAMKYVYNSTYGKMAQSIGKPLFSNAVYASLITAGCRTMILEAIATHPTKTRSLVMIATDGIYFTEPHPNLELSPTKLGAWDHEAYTGMTLMMPGLYWEDKARADVQAGYVPGVKSRGISPRFLKNIMRYLDNEWTKLEKEYAGELETPHGFEWPNASVELEFAFVSPREAASRGKWGLCGQLKDGVKQAVTSNPHTKRECSDQAVFCHPFNNPMTGLALGIDEGTGGLMAQVWPMGGYGKDRAQLETKFYERGFGDDVPEFTGGDLAAEFDSLKVELDRYETPDGPAGILAIRAFGVGT